MTGFCETCGNTACICDDIPPLHGRRIAGPAMVRKDLLDAAELALAAAVFEDAEYDDGTFMRSYRRCRICGWNGRFAEQDGQHGELVLCPWAQPGIARGAALLAAAAAMAEAGQEILFWVSDDNRRRVDLETALTRWRALLGGEGG